MRSDCGVSLNPRFYHILTNSAVIEQENTSNDYNMSFRPRFYHVFGVRNSHLRLESTGVVYDYRVYIHVSCI